MASVVTKTEVALAVQAVPEVVGRLVIEGAEATPTTATEGVVSTAFVEAPEAAAVEASLIEGVVAASPDEGVAVRLVVRVAPAIRGGATPGTPGTGLEAP